MSDDPATQPVCSWFQTGYCKFGELCTNAHITEICEDVNCLKKRCKLRHPISSRDQNDCRFGEECAYSHGGTTGKRLVDKLCERMNDLEKQLEAVISALIIPSKKKVDQIEQWAAKVTTEQDKCLNILDRLTIVTDTLPGLRESLRLTRWELGLGGDTGNSESELDTPDPALELDAVRTTELKCDKCNYIGRTRKTFTNHIKKHRNKVEETGADRQPAA